MLIILATFSSQSDQLQEYKLSIKRSPPPNSEIVISRKISPLTYPKKSWLFLKHINEALLKKKRKTSYLTAQGLSECQKVQKRQKTSKFYRIVWLFTLKKTSNQKMSEESNILAKDANTERKLEIKIKKQIRHENCRFFCAPKFRQLKSNCLELFLQNFILKISLLILLTSWNPSLWIGKRPSF